MKLKVLTQKILKIAILSTMITLIISKPYYPMYIWTEDELGYKCKLDDGTFRSTWKWLDADGDGIATCFYFDQDGYLVLNSITPDGNQVDDMGQWIVNGVVQQKIVSTEDIPINEEVFRKLLDKKYAEFVVNCDLIANEYLRDAKDPDYYIDIDEMRKSIIGTFENTFKPLVESLCKYYGYNDDIGKIYINKADNYSYKKYTAVRDTIYK